MGKRKHAWRNTGHPQTFAKAAALSVALVASACLMARTLASHDSAWLGYFTLLPLFLVIRISRPVIALFGGMLWGSSLYLFCWASSTTGMSTGLFSACMLCVVPSAYAFLGAWLTRRVACSPLVLGVGWMGVELALQPLGLQTGLLGGTQDGGILLHWVAGALGYACVAFLVAYVNASLVSVLAVARFTLPGSGLRTGSRDYGTLLAPQLHSCFDLLSIHASRPRAPPLVVVACSHR